MEAIILEVVERFGYGGICLLVMLENVFPPIPSEIILTFGGFLTTFSGLNAWGVVAAATIGSVTGGVILYAVGRLLNADRLERLFASYPARLLRLKKEDVRRSEKWFLKHGEQAVFFCRFVPIVRSLISLPAGAARMRLSAFLILTAAGSLIWNVVLIFLGRAAGEAWGEIVHYMDVYALIAAVLLGAALLLIGFVFVKRRFIGKGGKPRPGQD
jgi:membrane protein DedA with SNARE-associated domain